MIQFILLLVVLILPLDAFAQRGTTGGSSYRSTPSYSSAPPATSRPVATPNRPASPASPVAQGRTATETGASSAIASKPAAAQVARPAAVPVARTALIQYRTNPEMFLNQRRADISRNNVPRSHISSTRTSYGTWDALFLGFILYNMNQSSNAAWMAAHQNDAGVMQWRQDMNAQAEENPELRASLALMDERVAQATPSLDLPDGVSEAMAVSVDYINQAGNPSIFVIFGFLFAFIFILFASRSIMSAR